jgi:hypothetical protein
MIRSLRVRLMMGAALVMPGVALAYPGGTPSFQTDVAPYCAGCHSSRSADYLAGAGARAEKETDENKHIAVILSGQRGYAKLTETERKTLAEQVRALDEATTVEIEAPASVSAGDSFEVTVRVTGGAGPVVGVGLVDADHRWYARPAPSAGWTITGAPQIFGPDGKAQTDWLGKRPESAGRNLSFVNVTGISSDSATKKWASAHVVFTLRAPTAVGNVPLAASYWYGTEKASPLGFTTNTMGRKEVRGGFTGGSGRLLFSEVLQIQVK